MNQNNAAQPSIDLVLQILWPLACLVQPPGSGSSQGFTIPCATVRGVLEPVIEMLSKLRAPVADERAAFEYHARACELTRDEDVPDDYRNPHVQEYWNGWKARAALASVPVADGRALHIKALQDLRLGVEMDQHYMDDGDAKLAALDAAITALRWSAGALQALNIEADKITLDGETRTIGDILDHADRALASAPVAGEAQQPAKITFVNGDPASCGCTIRFSDGGGEYSDVHYVSLCGTHSGAHLLSKVIKTGELTRPQHEDLEGEICAALDPASSQATNAAPQASEADAMRLAIKTCGTKVIKALAAIARANGPDTRREDDPELLYRSPVMDEVVRIRQAYDELNAALSAQPEAQKEQSDA